MVKIKEGEGMSKSFLLLVGLMGGVLEAGREGEPEGGGSGSGQAARDQAARDQAAQAAREAAGRKPKRRGWAKPRGGGTQQQQPVEQGDQQGGGGQPGKGGSVVLKGSGGDGDAQAAELARARVVDTDPFGDLGETSAPTTRTASSAPVVTVQDVVKAVEEGFGVLKSVADNFVVAGSPEEAKMNRQADALKEAAGRFERVGGKEPAALKRVARDASRVEDIVSKSTPENLSAVPVREGIRISNGKRAATVDEVTLAFVSEGILGKILFPWRRYKLRKALKNIDNKKLEQLASNVEEKVAEDKRDENTNFPTKPNNTRNTREMNVYYGKLKEYILNDINYAVKAARYEGII